MVGLTVPPAVPYLTVTLDTHPPTVDIQGLTTVETGDPLEWTVTTDEDAEVYVAIEGLGDIGTIRLGPGWFRVKVDTPELATGAHVVVTAIDEVGNASAVVRDVNVIRHEPIAVSTDVTPTIDVMTQHGTALEIATAALETISVETLTQSED